MNVSESSMDAVRKRLEDRREQRHASESHVASLRTERSGFDWREIEQPARLIERARLLGIWNESAEEFFENPREAGNHVLEQIIDTNDLLDVTFLSEGARAARAVGRILLPVTGGTRLGTGFMVSPRVMMTNNHVLATTTQAGDATLEFDFFIREAGGTSPVERYRLQPDLLFLTDIALDFTVVAVQETNEAGAAVGDRGFHRLIAESGKAVVGERLNIIQHPGGDPQKVAVHDNTLVDVDGDFLHYRTDTMGGSSGSPVFNNQWDLVALHHAAVGALNEGARISRVVARLQQMLGQESMGDQSLLHGVLNAEINRPLPPPEPAGGQPSSAVSGAIGPTTEGDAANWVIPLRVSVALGDTASRPSASASLATPEPPSRTPAVLASPDPLLDDALDALDQCDARPYYDEDGDTQARSDYYPEELLALKGAALFSSLAKHLEDTHTTQLDYQTARLQHLYPSVDRRDPDSRELRCIYSQQLFDAEEVIRREVEMEHRREAAMLEFLRLEASVPEEEFLRQLETQSPFNCEHVVPQSWFDKKSIPKADLHHLFTCESRCNSFRSNHAFHEFGEEKVREGCGEAEDGKFEPLFGKAAAARATFYFLLRYPKEVANSSKEMPKARIKTLLAWHQSAPPDLWEKHRNAEIQRIQGNRNPFIDFPDLANSLKFDMGLV